MAKVNLIELALRGIDSSVLAANIATMNPSLIVATRIINGVEIPSKEQAQTYVRKLSSSYKEAEVDKVEMLNSFAEENVRIEFRYPRTVYWNSEYVQPADTPVVSYEEFRKMDCSHNCRERADETYKYKMTYWHSNWNSYVSENIVDE